jgi:hypothetical protein
MEIKAGQYWIDGMPTDNWFGVHIISVVDDVVTCKGEGPSPPYNTFKDRLGNIVEHLQETNSYLSKSDNFRNIYDILNSSES